MSAEVKYPVVVEENSFSDGETLDYGSDDSGETLGGEWEPGANPSPTSTQSTKNQSDNPDCLPDHLPDNNAGNKNPKPANTIYLRTCRKVLGVPGASKEKEELASKDASLLEGAILEAPHSLGEAISTRLNRKLSLLNPVVRYAKWISFLSGTAVLVSLAFGLPIWAVAPAWASVWVIVQAALRSAGLVKGLSDLVPELCCILAQLQAHEKTLPHRQGLDATLEKAYEDTLVFLIRTLHFVRSCPTRQVFVVRRAPWDQLREDGRVLLSHLHPWLWASGAGVDIDSRTGPVGNDEVEPDSHGDLILLRDNIIPSDGQNLQSQDQEQQAGPLVPQTQVQDSNDDTDDTNPDPDPDPENDRFHYVPSLMGLRFCHREDEIHAILAGFDVPPYQSRYRLFPQKASTVRTATKQDPSPRSFVLFGIGGVGKTQIALQYAHLQRDFYDDVLWVNAQNLVTARDSFRSITRGLRLVDGPAEDQNTACLTLRVKRWLEATDRKWLLIFDGADDVRMLADLWPDNNAKGHILVTTRDIYGRHPYPGTQSSYHVRPFSISEGRDFLLDAMSVSVSASDNHRTYRDALWKAATQISRRLGGLPLALDRAAGYMADHGLELPQFQHIISGRDADALEDLWSGVSQSHNTIATIWHHTLVNVMSPEFRCVLGVLAYFHPECGVDEATVMSGNPLATVGQSGDIPADALSAMPSFSFLAAEGDLDRALNALVQLGTIHRDPATRVISMHPLLQQKVLRLQGGFARAGYLNVAVRVVSRGFVDRWTRDRGHQFRLHRRAARCVPHVRHLMTLWNRGCRHTDLQAYAAMLLGAAWYLYEKQHYVEAQDMAEAVLDALDHDRSNLVYAGAADLNGQIYLDLNDGVEAGKAFQQAFAIRSRLPAGQAASAELVALSTHNYGRALTDLDHDLVGAERLLQSALETRQQIEMITTANPTATTSSSSSPGAAATSSSSSSFSSPTPLPAALPPLPLMSGALPAPPPPGPPLPPHVSLRLLTEVPIPVPVPVTPVTTIPIPAAAATATAIATQHNDLLVASSHRSIAALLLRLGRFREAEAALSRCPKLIGVEEEGDDDGTDDDDGVTHTHHLLGGGGGGGEDAAPPVRYGNPLFCGELLLMSRIRAARGLAEGSAEDLEEAQWLASSAYTWRMRMLGTAALGTVDAGYDCARLRWLRGDLDLALAHCNDLERITDNMPEQEGLGQRARIYFLMSGIHRAAGHLGEGAWCEDVARRLRAEYEPDFTSRPYTEEEFDKLRAFMIW